MQPTARDAVKRVLTTAGITGAALTLAATAAAPAFADGGDDHGTSSQHSSQASNGSDNSKAADNGKSGDAHGNSSQGGSTDAGHNPPGNNGTVKIHQTGGDSSPHNQPHVSCYFYVSFFGFDNGQTMTVSFAGQAPTGKDTPIAIKDSTLTSKTSTTDAGGAGNDYDGDLGKYDATNLDLSALGAPARQGYHIKLDVATGEPGGHKYKVFWFSPCTGTTTSGGTTEQQGGEQQGGEQQGGEQQGGEQTPTVSGTEQQTTPAVGGEQAGAGPATGTTAGVAQVLGEQMSRGTTGASTPAGAQVLGEQMTRPSAAGLASLPFTGAETGVLSALGLGAVAGGAALVVAGRRRRAAGRA
jgi:LPXTG-motif cell wall-anchored protein